MNDERLTEIVVSAFIKELSSDIKSLFKGALDEAKQFLENGIKSYIENQHSRFISTKTILKGNTPSYFYDVYHPLNIKNDKHTTATTSINSTFEKSKYITVVGDAGSGKSTLVKHLFLRALNERNTIPVFIELRYVTNERNSIELYIKEKIFSGKLSENTNILERMLSNGNFLFFLDGYDEIAGESKKAVTEGINNFIERYGKNKYLLTTRPYSDIGQLPLFHNYNIEQLSKEKGDIDAFIDRQLKEEPELATQIKKSIKEAKVSYINSFLKNLYYCRYTSLHTKAMRQYLQRSMCFIEEL